MGGDRGEGDGQGEWGHKWSRGGSMGSRSRIWAIWTKCKFFLQTAVINLQGFSGSVWEFVINRSNSDKCLILEAHRLIISNKMPLSTDLYITLKCPSNLIEGFGPCFGAPSCRPRANQEKEKDDFLIRQWASSHAAAAAAHVLKFRCPQQQQQQPILLLLVSRKGAAAAATLEHSVMVTKWFVWTIKSFSSDRAYLAFGLGCKCPFLCNAVVRISSNSSRYGRAINGL